MGYHPAGIFGYSHAMGGFKGSHAEYVRLPFADHIAFPERIARGELKTAHLATHPMPLDDGARGYDLFKQKQDGCVRSVFQPSA